MKHFISFLLRMLRDQRGEVGDLDASDLSDALVVDEPEETPDNPEDGDADPDPEDTPDDDPEKKGQGEDQLETLRAELEELKNSKGSKDSEIEDLKKEINRLGYALRKAEKGEAKDEEATFTDAQLLQMMKDHQDEPDVLFQVIKQMQKQAGASIEKSAEQRALIQTRNKELADLAEKMFPGAMKEDSTVYADIQKTKSYLGLEDNPHGDVLSLAVMSMNNLPNLINGIKAQVRKELLGKTADDKRKGKIKESQPADQGHQQTPEKLSGTADETAQRLGMNKRQKELYQKFLSAGKKASTVQTAA